MVLGWLTDGWSADPDWLPEETPCLLIEGPVNGAAWPGHWEDAEARSLPLPCAAKALCALPRESATEAGNVEGRRHESRFSRKPSKRWGTREGR